MAKFLELIAKELINKFDDFSRVTVVLPSNRAGVFLINHLQKHISKPTLLPNIITLDKLVEQISGLTLLDQSEITIQLYQSYLAVTNDNNPDSFEEFSYWSSKLLRDFHDIDRYLIEPKQVFELLQDIEVLKRWKLEPIDKTKLIEEQLQFWHQLPDIYQHFNQSLSEIQSSYAGMLYKSACKTITTFLNNDLNHYVLVGFNAISHSETFIFKTLLEHAKADIYWDIDQTFIKDPIHEAGLFLRKIKSDWSYYKTHPFEWIFEQDFSQRQINVHAVPSAIGQAKMLSELLSNFTHEQLNNTVVVLGDETLLYPILEHLPPNVSEVNISMSYPIKHETIQLLIQNIFKLHISGFKNKSRSFYHKDILAVIDSPWLRSLDSFETLKQKIISSNSIYLSSSWLIDFDKNNPLFSLIFEPFSDVDNFINRLKQILLFLIETTKSSHQNNDITLPIIYAIYHTLEKILNQESLIAMVHQPDFLFKIYQELIGLSKVSFEGKPLVGLQIMGVLETRTLDFDHVIITNVNEGVFPASKSFNSFIPHDVKLSLGLPTFFEKDAVFAYHFYHIIQRAKQVHLLYNNQSSGVFDSGEPSRFIHQLLHNKQANLHTYTPKIPNKTSEELLIEKSPLLMQRLQEIALKGFSPTALAAYLRDTKQFFFQRILSNRDPDEVEENIAANTFGTVIHRILEQIYQPYINKQLEHQHLLDSIPLLPDFIETTFKEVYNEGNIKTGINYIALKVIQKYLEKYLSQEAQLASQNNIQILHLEENFKYQLLDNSFPFEVYISGNIDRVELFNNNIRLIDYKTGKVEPKDLKMSNIDDMFLSEEEDKILQLSCYLLMLKDQYPNHQIEAGIVSMRNMNDGFMPLCIKNGRGSLAIENHHFELLEQQITNLVHKVLDSQQPFDLKVIN